MSTQKEQLPINYTIVAAASIFKQIVENIPDDIEVYLIAGSLRNAIYRYLHGEILFQRDYDQIITKNSKAYFEYLTSHGFFKGAIDKPTQLVMKYPLIENPAIDDHAHLLTFDMHIVEGTYPIDNLRKHVGLTINGFALSLKDIYTSDWRSHLISIPGAWEDLSSKRLRVNLDGYKDQAANFFSLIRFISAGFTPPSDEEVRLLLHELPRVETERFDKNVKKVWSYVGGETNARKIVADLGIKIDVFDEAVVKSKL